MGMKEAYEKKLQAQLAEWSAEGAGAVIRPLLSRLYRWLVLRRLKRQGRS